MEQPNDTSYRYQNNLIRHAHDLTTMIPRYISRQNIQSGHILSADQNHALEQYLMDIEEYKTDLKRLKNYNERSAMEELGLSRQMVLDELEEARSQILSFVTERDMPGGRRRMRRTRKTRRSRRTRKSRRSRK